MDSDKSIWCEVCERRRNDGEVDRADTTLCLCTECRDALDRYASLSRINWEWDGKGRSPSLYRPCSCGSGAIIRAGELHPDGEIRGLRDMARERLWQGVVDRLVVLAIHSTCDSCAHEWADSTEVARCALSIRAQLPPQPRVSGL
jgi:hypothetical protein